MVDRSRLNQPVDTMPSPRSALAELVLPSLPLIATLSPAANMARLVLRMAPAVAEAIETRLPIVLSVGINRVGIRDECAALRLGPDEWLLLPDAERDPWLAARLAESADGAALSIVDVSHRQAGLVLQGPEVEAVLAAGCPLPLDRASFPVGRATRTLVGKTEIVLWRRAHDAFHLDVARSFAPYLVAFIAEAIANEAAIGRLGRS